MKIIPKVLRKKIAKLPVSVPITEKYEARIRKRRTGPTNVWYSSQNEHWLGWLENYDGPGAYGRSSWDVSAEVVYNRVVNSAMVLYLGEASGVATPIVKAAAAAGLKAGPTMQSQSAAIRALIPWSLIESQLTAKR